MTCFVPSCATALNFYTIPAGMTKHRFPADKARQMEWLQAIAKAENCQPYDLKALNWNNDRICSKHFHTSFFHKLNNRVRLHKNATPFADPENTDILPKEPKPPEKQSFKCEICDKMLKNKQSLNLHKETHLDPEQRQTFRCKICKATYKSQLGLNYHQKTKHIQGNEREKLPCPMCGRIFKSAEGRKIHMTIQHGAGGPIFKCKECPMVFARKPHLDLHMATHGSGLHVCTICGKSYARLKDLSRHEATCGVEELCCPVCGKQLRTEQALKNHRKKCRSEGRTFRCSTCGQKFATEKALGSHEAVHQQPFQCAECPETFVTVRALQNHEQTKHWEMLRFESGDDEKRKRPGKSDSGSDEEVKARTRRSKYDLFIGLEHLADPSTLIEEVKPVEAEPKPAELTPRKFLCEQCPQIFASLQGMDCHRKKQHWKVLGLAEPRVPKRKRPLKRISKRLRRPRKLVNRVEPEEFSKVIESVTTLNVRKNRKPFEEPKPECIEVDELIIKEEIVEFENFESNYFENDSTCDDNVKEETFEPVTADLKVVEDSTKDGWGKQIIHGESIDKSQFVRCPSCRTKFATDEEMAVHRCLKGIVRERERPFKCDLCDKAYFKQIHLEGHYSVHPEYHNLKCDQCPKGFFNESELNRHKKKAHIVKELYYACETCNQLFKSQQNLERHQELHSENLEKSSSSARRLKCSFPSCGKTFTTYTSIKIHEQSHTKDYKFKCKFCEYGAFFGKRVLLHEQRRHNHNRFAAVNDL